MGKYLIKRLIYSVVSLVVILFIIMTLIYVFKSRDTVFIGDDTLSKQGTNEKVVYKLRRWEEYGYLDFMTYDEYMVDVLEQDGVTDEELIVKYKTIPSTKAQISTEKDTVKKNYLLNFEKNLTAQGYTVEFLDYKGSSGSKYYAYKDVNVFVRLGRFIGNLFSFENTSYVDKSISMERSIAWGWDEYSNAPALFGSGTKHKYLIYFDHSPFLSQNWFHVNLGTSNANETKGQSVESVLFDSQGDQVYETKPYPAQFDDINLSNEAKNVNLRLIGTLNGTTIYDEQITTNKVSINVDDIKSTYSIYKDGVLVDTYKPMDYTSISGQFDFYFTDDGLATVVCPTSTEFYALTVNSSESYVPDGIHYLDRYSNETTKKSGLSRIGYSFVCGIIATVIAYFIGLPLGILMAKRKDKFADHLGNAFIVFMIAVPSLAYIYFFRAIGKNLFHLPGSFSDNASPQWLVFILPIFSLMLPTIANLMKWQRRYMVDQSNSDYVKFARSQGLSEGEIFRKHIAKNAAIPIIQGIPASILSCLVGAFYTETVYSIPGSGRLLTDAINSCDNGTIVALGFFYAFLSIVALILGDILMTIVDPRISFSDGRRK